LQLYLINKRFIELTLLASTVVANGQHKHPAHTA